MTGSSFYTRKTNSREIAAFHSGRLQKQERVSKFHMVVYSRHLHWSDSILIKQKHHACLQRHATHRLWEEGLTLNRKMTPNTCERFAKMMWQPKKDHGAVTVMDIPQLSPDLNPDDHLRGHLMANKVECRRTLQTALWSIYTDNTGHQTCGDHADWVHAVFKAMF